MDRLAELRQVSRQYLAAYVLFNQAVADRLGMHPTDVQCLNLLTLEPEPLTTGQIADLTGLTSGSATRLVDRLERGGYVRRERDTRDRRRVLVLLDEERLGEFGRMWAELSEGWDEMFTGYTDGELSLLARHMRRTIDLGAAQRARLRAERESS
ncbi:MarR family winged helix-turn-helix transcriptional regulator [Actinophytocola oryzae]|uniref:DNA-binding MarR family transcriptional regulator n=1 Tax=Actinophytocola oryzae TaxID=502181 RepID=A0A4R7VQC9_9PSEU|nr:MarR family transcriptional regulator [Actinophytocola oryzae]TDV51946.1 DNA-binding MarR family transcriptional regulator [Actinophytocola oryzae]